MNISFICQYFWQKYPIFDRSRKFWIFVIGVPLTLVAYIKIKKSHLKGKRRLGLLGPDSSSGVTLVFSGSKPILGLAISRQSKL